MLVRHLATARPCICRRSLRQSSSAAAASATSPHLTTWLTNVSSRVLRQEDHVSLSHIQSLVSTLEVNADGPAASWRAGDTLPEGWTVVLFPPAFATTSSLGPDGTERTPHHPPAGSGLDERMWVGGSFHFAEQHRIKIGDQVECEARITDVKKRTGKDGRTGYYVEQTREIRRVGAAQPAVVESRMHLYRPSLGATPAPAVDPPPRSAVAAAPTVDEADFSYSLLPTQALLLRFSALTFNTHRIHWDEAYCKDVEGREGLIVHGPLTALLLLHTFKHALPSTARVESFNYRATAPLVVGRAVTFNGRWLNSKTEAGKRECRLWVSGEDGTVYMSGTGTAVAPSH